MKLIDRYANDAYAWRISAQIDYTASRMLFETNNLMLVFPAAHLGHLAIEKYLKAALICTGAIICNPHRHKELIASGRLNRDECAWDHKLVKLAAMLASRRSDFDPAVVLFEDYPLHEGPMTLNDALEMFDPFFVELRYPIQMENFKTLGSADVMLFLKIIAALDPFAQNRE